MKNQIATVLVATGLLASGCSTLNSFFTPKQSTVEIYRIFDIKTSADRDAISESASKGLTSNVTHAKEARPILVEEIPEKPLRFAVVDMFEGTKFAALMGGAGNVGMKIATCKGAIWTAEANRDSEGVSELKLTACLFPYKEGYHLDLYATMVKEEGGLMQIPRGLVTAAVGTPEQWTEKTFLDIVRRIRSDTKAEISLVEGYPKLKGTPWLDEGEEIALK